MSARYALIAVLALASCGSCDDTVDDALTEPITDLSGQPIRCDNDDVHCRCYTLDIDECSDDDRCYIENGQPLDEANGCWLEAEPAGCVPVGQACANLTYYGVDADGDCWQLGGDCGLPHFDVSGKASDACKIQGNGNPC